jgi:hypothetical protein
LRNPFSQSWQTTITGLNLVTIFISEIGFCVSHRRHLKVISAVARFFTLLPPFDVSAAMLLL